MTINLFGEPDDISKYTYFENWYYSKSAGTMCDVGLMNLERYRVGLSPNFLNFNLIYDFWRS